MPQDVLADPGWARPVPLKPRPFGVGTARSGVGLENSRFRAPGHGAAWLSRPAGFGRRLSLGLETQLRGETGGRDVGWLGGEAQVGEDLADRTDLEDGRDRLEIAAALRAMLHVSAVQRARHLAGESPADNGEERFHVIANIA